VKTIISIIEVILYNLFPATLAAPVIVIMKDIIPLIGIASIRVILYLWASVQKFQSMVSQKPVHNKLLHDMKYENSTIHEL
jgi:hypothetical protein